MGTDLWQRALVVSCVFVVHYQQVVLWTNIRPLTSDRGRLCLFAEANFNDNTSFSSAEYCIPIRQLVSVLVSDATWWYCQPASTHWPQTGHICLFDVVKFNDDTWLSSTECYTPLCHHASVCCMMPSGGAVNHLLPTDLNQGHLSLPMFIRS